MTENTPLLQIWTGLDTDLFLLRVLRERDENTSHSAETAFAELMRLASEEMDRLVLRAPAQHAREEAIAEVLHRASIGLELEADGDITQADALLNEHPITRFVRVGEALYHRLREDAETVQENLFLQANLPTALVVLHELQLANPVEETFLDRLKEGRLALTAPMPRLETVPKPRRLASLDDFRNAGVMLRFLDVRAELFRRFPQGRLFAHVYPTDPTGDTARIIVGRLFVRIAVRGASEPRFDLTEADLERFRAVQDGFVARKRIEDWIAHFTETHLPPDDRETARAYLLDCLASLRDILPYLLD